MVWYRNPAWLWSIIAALVAGLVGFAVLSPDGEHPGTWSPPRIVETGSPACVRAAKAGEQVARAAGTALYAAPDVAPLVRAALVARAQTEVANVRERLRALISALRRARSFSERGEPPAWWRFDRSSARCLGGSAMPLSYEAGIGNEDDAAAMVRAFVRARIRNHGAQRFVSADGRDEFGQPGGLAPLYPTPALESFEVVFTEGLGDGSYEVGVELEFLQDSYGETLFVSFDGYRYRIDGGRSGLGGP